MDAPYITFYTPTKREFRHTAGYDEVTITELELLLRQGREAVVSLEGELMKRQPARTIDQSANVSECCQRLHNAGRELGVVEHLEGRAIKQVDDAVNILTSLQTSPSSKTYQSFLYDVLRHCGEGLVLLCAASLGKKRVVDLGSKDRVSLLAYLRATQISLDVPILKPLAQEYGIPSFTSTYIIDVGVSGV